MTCPQFHDSPMDYEYWYRLESVKPPSSLTLVIAIVHTPGGAHVTFVNSREMLPGTHQRPALAKFCQDLEMGLKWR